MMGFIIDLYLNMWLIPSFFRVHILHSTIVGMTTLIEIAVYKYTIYNVNKESAVYPIDDHDLFCTLRLV